MGRNLNLNLNISARVARQFREAAKHYDGRIGLCASAALLMWLEADPKTQGAYLSEVFQLDLTDQVDDSLQAVKDEQARKVAERERHEGQGQKRGRTKPAKANDKSNEE